MASLNGSADDELRRDELEWLASVDVKPDAAEAVEAVAAYRRTMRYQWATLGLQVNELVEASGIPRWLTGRLVTLAHTRPGVRRG